MNLPEAHAQLQKDSLSLLWKKTDEISDRVEFNSALLMAKEKNPIARQQLIEDAKNLQLQMKLMGSR